MEIQFPLKLKEANPENQGLHGKTTSQGTESMNHANLAVRSFGGDFVSWLSRSVEAECARFNQHKSDSQKGYDDLMPPTIKKKISDMKDGSGFQAITGSASLGDNKYKVHYCTPSQPGKPLMVHARIADFSRATPICSCGEPELNEFPCDHLLYACEKAGVLPQAMLHSQDTLTRWKTQYQVAGDFNIPDTSCLEDAEPTANLLMPLATPVPRGGISKKRKDCAIRRVKEQRKKYIRDNAAAVGVPPHCP